MLPSGNVDEWKQHLLQVINTEFYQDTVKHFYTAGLYNCGRPMLANFINGKGGRWLKTWLKVTLRMVVNVSSADVLGKHERRW